MTNCNITQEKITDIESSITKLVTIQDIQIKQTDKILGALDKSSYINNMVEQNNKDINKLTERLSESIEIIHEKENLMTARIDLQRKELDAIGQGRLWKGVSVAVGVTVFAFGYFYQDLHGMMNIMDNSRLTQREMNIDIRHIKNDIEKLSELQKVHLREIRNGTTKE